MSTFLGLVKEFKDNSVKFDNICSNKNFAHLINELMTKKQSIKSEFLDSLTAKKILTEITFYGNKNSSKDEYDITNLEKLLLIFCLYHNFAWRKFVQLYQAAIEGGTGGRSYSQFYLVPECNKKLKSSAKIPVEHKRFDVLMSELDSISERIDDLRKKLRSNVDLLESKSILRSKIGLDPPSTDLITRYYIHSVRFESGQILVFKYKCPDTKQNCLKPNAGADHIKLTPLLDMIKIIFQNPTRRKIQLESDGMKLTFYNLYNTNIIILQLKTVSRET